MNGINRVLAALMFIASGYYGVVWAKQMGYMQASKPLSKIAWHTDENEALKLARQRNLPVIIDFTADWCAVCHEIDSILFQNPQIIAKLRGLIPLRLDVTKETPENAALLQKYGILSLPAIIFISRDGNILEKPRIHGLVPIEVFLDTLEQL